jgi:acetyltransferase-like isoleucine patch superfamily enzyme
MRVEIEAPWRVDFRGAPRLRITDAGRGGTLRIKVGRDARIEDGVRMQVQAGGVNELELGERVVLQDGTRLWLTGGAIRLGKGTILRDGCTLKSGGELVVGEFVRIGSASVVHCSERIELADRSGYADCVVIVDVDHPHDGSDTWFLDLPDISTPVLIGRNTMVAALVLITRGAVVGPNAQIAGSSVVMKGDHPGGWLIAGTPARPVRELGPRPTGES